MVYFYRTDLSDQQMSKGSMPQTCQRGKGGYSQPFSQMHMLECYNGTADQFINKLAG